MASQAEDLGRAGLLLAGAAPASDRAAWPAPPAGVRYAVDVVECSPSCAAATHRMLRKWSSSTTSPRRGT